MTHQRQSSIVSVTLSTSSDLNAFSDTNKENIPLHSQISLRIQNAQNSKCKPHAKKLGLASPSGSINQPKTPNHDVSKQVSPIKFPFPLSKTSSKTDSSSTSYKFSRQSWNIEEGETKGPSNSDRDLEKYSIYNEVLILGYSTQNGVRAEKEILIQEFRGLGQKLKQVKMMEKKTGLSGYYSDRKGKSELNIKRRKPSLDTDGNVFQRQILEKIDELNERYKQLALNIANYRKMHVLENQGGSSNDEYIKELLEDRNMVAFKKLEKEKRSEVLSRMEDEIEDVRDQIRKNEEAIGSRKNPLDKGEGEEEGGSTKSWGDSLKLKKEMSSASSKSKESKSVYDRVLLGSLKGKGQKPRSREEEIERREKELRRLEEELLKREQELDKREKNFEANEAAFDNLAREMEKQSEELVRQKMEINRKIELLSINTQKLEKEKEEFYGSKAENEKLQNIRKEIHIEQSMLERKCQEMLREHEEFKRMKFMLERKEEEIRKKGEKVQEDMKVFNKEKAEFLKEIEEADKKLREREEYIREWEKVMELGKLTSEEFDMKLMGIKLNEQVWQKKREMEVLELQNKVKAVKDKERELRAREEKVSRMMEEIRRNKKESGKGECDSRDTNASERMISQDDEKGALDITVRTISVENANKEGMESC